MLVSIIIIGKNEGWKLRLCFESVVNAFQFNSVPYEMIYVDSDSIDDSINIAKEFNSIKIIKLTGKFNAAVARNEGAKVAKGELYLFLDGDMELDSNFIKVALELDWTNKYSYISGHLDDYYYDKNHNFIGFKPRTYTESLPKDEKILTTNGGAFILKKVIWKRLGGMRVKYKRSQDLDLCIRLNRLGIKLVRIPYFMAKHHTISYQSKDRIWDNTLNGYSLYGAMLLRDHLSQKIVWKKALRNNYSALLLILVLMSVFISNTVTLLLASGYLLVLTIRSISKSNYLIKLTKSVFTPVITVWFNQLARDVMYIYGFVAFFPSNDIKYKVSFIQNFDSIS